MYVLQYNSIQYYTNIYVQYNSIYVLYKRVQYNSILYYTNMYSTTASSMYIHKCVHNETITPCMTNKISVFFSYLKLLRRLLPQ